MTAVQASLSPFALAHAELVALGYSPVPIVAADAMHHRGRGKAPGRYQSGGWQGMTGWETLRTTPLTGFALSMAMASPGANVGVVMGTPAGKAPDGTPLFVISIDIDTEDVDAFDEIVRAIPASPMRAKGRKGWKSFLRAPQTVRSRGYDDARIPSGQGLPRRLVDLLTGFDTKQAVVAPSIHPDTGIAYAWLDGPVAATDLPIFDEGALEKLEDTLRGLGWDPEAARNGRGERKPFVPAAHVEGDAFDVVKAAALANLSAWVPELPGLYNLRPARGGYEAVNTRRSSSSGQPLERRKRNLSIQKDGIKDFGTGETWSAIDLVADFGDMSVSEALTWLEDRLGLGDDGSVVLELGSTGIQVHPDDDLPEPLRVKAPPVQGPKPALQISLAEQKQSVVRADAPPVGSGIVLSGGAMTPPTASIAKAASSTTATPCEMPAHLLQVPGLVGQIIDYVVASARKPQRVLALATALTVVGTCGGRRYAGPTGSGTHLYALACAKSGAGKDHGLDMAARLMTAAGMTAHIGKGEWMSFQAVYRGLSQQPLTLNPIDELGGFLRRINKRTSGGNEQAITAVLRTAWGKSFKMLPPPGWAGQDMEPIWSPALSILGASTHDDFFKAIEAGDTDNGFLNRWLLFSTQERPAVHKPTADLFEVPQGIVDGMLSIYQSGNALAKATMHAGRCDRPDVVVQWSDGPDGALNRAYLAWAEQLDEASDAESFFARAAEQAIRLATIRAMGCNPLRPVIDAECFAWAKEVSLWCANRMLLDAREFMAENQTQSDRAKVVRAIRTNSPITHRDLLRKLTTFKTRDLEEIIKGLDAAELVRIDPTTAASNGRRSKLYTWLGDQ